jgi:hypothetical protein
MGAQRDYPPDQPVIANHPDSSYLVVNKKYAKLNVAQVFQAAWYPDLASAIQGWVLPIMYPLGTHCMSPSITFLITETTPT